MILLSLVLVVASAVALGWGIMTTTDQLVWGSLVAGLLAVGLVAGSVVRLRRRVVVESPAPPAPAGVPERSAAPVPASAEPAASPAAEPSPSAEPSPTVETPASGDVRAPVPATGAWPWPTRPADGPSRSGWTGPVGPPGAWTGQTPAQTAPAPAAQAHAQPAPAQPAPDTAAQPAPAAAAPAGEVAPAPVQSGAVGEALGVAADRPLGESFPVDDGEPAVEDIPVRDALRVAQLPDEVRVVDGHPRYHLGDCPTLAGADALPMPVSAARRAGFTPCGVCGPDRTLLSRVQDRRRLS